MMDGMQVWQYRVTGPGDLPYDMLRYDASYPASERDAARATHHPGDGRRTVTLEHRGVHRGWAPNVARWASFGWAVEPGSVTTRGA